jgi:primosomal protein N' (replication factor Y)
MLAEFEYTPSPASLAVSALLAGETPAGYAPDAPATGAPYVEVVIDAITLANSRPFTYRVPDAWRGKLLPGMAVLVPFGYKFGVAGYISALSHKAPTDYETRELEDVISGEVIPPALQALLLWLADTTMTPLSAVLTTAMPRGTLSRVKRSVILSVSLETFKTLSAPWSGPRSVLAGLLLASDGTCSLARLQTAIQKSGSVLGTWRAQGLIRYHTAFLPPERKEKTLLHASALAGAQKALTTRQAEILAYLRHQGGCLPIGELAKAMGTTASTLKGMEKKGAIAIHPQAVRRSQVGHENFERWPTLTPHQAEVLEEIEGALGTASTFLLHGVTGSGKTEVYLRAIARVLERGEGAIVLVPEISLTPQTVRRFQARFGDMVAVLHSHLGDGERYDEWQRIRSGEARVAIGARSAIFAPMPKLGLIIIDESHETSYKQDKAPRYHANSVAEARSRFENAPLILGSATPSLESYEAAQAGRTRLLKMPDRVEGRPMPPVTIIDMREELASGNRNLFSRRLKMLVTEALERKEQAILLLNRRGYSSFVFCRDCGYACRCERCAVALTFHQNPERLRCHYCDAVSTPPKACPQCHSAKIRHFGAGTQQIEDATRKLFPEARVIRLDRDTTTRKGSHQTMLDAFGRQEYDILIGTQMVAKGLDFPHVTVVGVMAADGALHLPDFRASEHTFQLLTQVAGRAGRGNLPSQVVVQTYSPTHPAILAARDHDFMEFYQAEIESRKELRYPPYAQLANILFAGPNLQDTLQCAERLTANLPERAGLEVLGPATAPLAMLKGLHRFYVLLKADDLATLRSALREALPNCQQPGVRIAVDLDPYTML